MKLILSLSALWTFSAFGTTLKFVSIESDALDRSDPHHVAQQIFDAMNTPESTTGKSLIRTTKTNGRITCTKVVDELLGDSYATWACDFAHKESPTGFPHFKMSADADAVNIIASPDYFKNIDLSAISGADCSTVSVPGRLATPPHDKTTCEFKLR